MFEQYNYSLRGIAVAMKAIDCFNCVICVLSGRSFSKASRRPKSSRHGSISHGWTSQKEVYSPLGKLRTRLRSGGGLFLEQGTGTVIVFFFQLKVTKYSIDLTHDEIHMSQNSSAYGLCA